jgi:hypothetical protein
LFLNNNHHHHHYSIIIISVVSKSFNPIVMTRYVVVVVVVVVAVRIDHYFRLLHTLPKLTDPISNNLFFGVLVGDPQQTTCFVMMMVMVGTV